MIKLDRFWKTVIFSYILVFTTALLDITSEHSGLFGTIEEYTSGHYPAAWWPLFQAIVLAGFVLLALAYYFIIHKDLSESLAIAIVPYIAWMFGLADIMYFWIQRLPVPETLPWLVHNPYISFFNSFFGSTVVTAPSLFLSALVGIGLGISAAYGLKRYF